MFQSLKANLPLVTQLPKGPYFGLLAEFATPADLYHACERVRGSRRRPATGEDETGLLQNLDLDRHQARHYRAAASRRYYPRFSRR